MRLETVDHHSFFPDILAPGGAVLDVGARGFVFAREMARRGHHVVAMEPDPVGIEGVVPASGHLEIVSAALVGAEQPTQQKLARWDNGEANRLVTPTTPRPGRQDVDEIDVPCISITSVSQFYGVKVWDLVKMNCEGSEFEVLRTWPGPIARQISVSFHDHTGANPRGEETYREIFLHLAPWYVLAQHVWEERYCAGFSYWDSVLVLRELFPGVGTDLLSQCAPPLNRCCDEHE